MRLNKQVLSPMHNRTICPRCSVTTEHYERTETLVGVPVPVYHPECLEVVTIGKEQYYRPLQESVT